jgi:hypothetical protein
MADHADGGASFHVNLRPRERWSPRRRRVTLLVAFVLCGSVLIPLERRFPGALDSLLALGLFGCALYLRKLPVRIGGVPVWAWYLAAAACFVALAIVDARAG